jgi:hypothetical protein
MNELWEMAAVASILNVEIAETAKRRAEIQGQWTPIDGFADNKLKTSPRAIHRKAFEAPRRRGHPHLRIPNFLTSLYVSKREPLYGRVCGELLLAIGLRTAN